MNLLCNAQSIRYLYNMEIERVPISVYAEMTPNPAVMKFVSNKRMIELEHVEYHNIEEASNSPLAIKLFHFPFVKEVFISSNFVAVQKYNVVEWETVTQEIRELVLEFLQSGQAVMIFDQLHEVKKTADAATPEENPTELSEIEGRIVDLLEEYVKPAVQQDGGNISFVSYENKIVKVQLQGACSGCPSSTLTLQSGIKSILQRMLPTLIEDVVPV